MCYVVQPKKKEGSLLIDLCIQKGVPPGPLLGKLKSGMDITLPNGTVVKSDEVRSPDCPGPVFIGTQELSLNFRKQVNRPTNFKLHFVSSD